MALMLPSVCPGTAPPGEHELFRRLRDDPDTSGWIVLHSLDLARHIQQVSGEADFAVIVPSHGILVIEVKSHRTVSVDEKGWHLGHDPVDTRGPFKQASEAMHSIRRFLTDSDASFASLLMWSAVCFPRLNFRKRSPEWHDWQVIDRSLLTGRPISRSIIAILAQGRDLLLQKGVLSARDQERHASPSRCEMAGRLLRPRFELAMSPKTRRREQDEELLRLTEEQFEALDQSSLNPRVVFSGPAGTGKTVLAVETLRRAVVTRKAKRPAMLCFNKLLGAELASRVQSFAPHATVAHIDGWLAQLANPLLSRADRDDASFFRGLLAERAADALLLNETSGPPFDFLVVDEAQDILQPHYLDVIDLALEGGLAGGLWNMFGDFVGQDIFAQGQLGLESFVADRCPNAARFLLTTNCRNTRAISEYVVALGRLNPPYRRVLRPDDHVDPELVFWRTRDQQKALIVSFLRKCLDDGFRPSDIVMLSPRADGSAGLELTSNPTWSSLVAPWADGTGRISFTTIQAFKGLEAPIVLITDFDCMDTSQQQSLFYIGLSRALHRLAIFLNDDLKSFVRSIT